MFYGMRVEPGATVQATDGRFGTVEEVMLQPDTGDLSYLVVRHGADLVRIPAGMINEVTDPREVHLGLTNDVAHARVAGHVEGLDARPEDSSQIRIPLHEERLEATVEPISLGEVRIHKLVEDVEETVEQEVTRDDLDIERVPMHLTLDAPASPRQEDGWYVVPIMKEVLVVQKRLMLVEEVRIRTRRVTEVAQVRETVRHERITVEDATVHGIDGIDDGLLEGGRRASRRAPAASRSGDPAGTE